MNWTRALLGFAVLCLGCGASNEVGPSENSIPTGSERYVTIGFWTDTDTLTDCTQDVPPTLYARIIDFSGCAGAAR